MTGLAMMKTGMDKKGMDKEKQMLANKVAEIISILFADRTFAHMAHLKTSSYSTHMALNDFYDSEEEEADVTDLADDLAEAAQGRCGKLDIPVGVVGTNLTMPADHLEASLEKILKISEGCKARALAAIVDDIEELYLSTIYKIRELH